MKGENIFKIRAYARAAEIAGSHPGELSEVVRSGGEKALREIPGIGPGLAKNIVELVETGRSKDFEAIKASLPEGLLELMQVPGLGPKTALAVCTTLKVKDLDGLEAACLAHKVAGLPRMGEKAEAKILAGIALRRQGMERKLLSQALAIAEPLVAELMERPEVSRCEPAGSLRRRKETVGDLDLLVVSTDPEKTIRYFTERKAVQRILGAGGTKATVMLRPTETGEGAFQCDLRVVDERSFGAALHYFTGSKEHNVRVRERAREKGLKVNEYGVFRLPKGKAGKDDAEPTGADWTHYVSGKEEEDVFRAIGLPYIAPELREDAGEFDAAERDALPDLVELKDLQGDLHAHTDWSDGSATIEQMAAAAKALGHKYLAISDHSKGERQANGLFPDRVEKQLAILAKLNAEYAKKKDPFRLLSATECDILPDGSMDFDDALLEKFDVVVASVHTGWKQTEDEMTARVVKAVKNPFVTVLGHPTGRLIHQRPPFAIRLTEVFRAAKQAGTFVEIDSHPARMDLKDVHAREAGEAGCILSIDSDAHAIGQLALKKFGVWTARRAWLTKSQIANARPLAALLELIDKKRTRAGATKTPLSRATAKS